MRRKILLSIAFAALFYIGLSIWSDFGALSEAFQDFKLVYILPILGLSLANYALRFVKWQYYLRTLGISVPRMDSFLIHIAGLSMSITPGKFGEVIKSYLLKEAYAIPISRTATVVFADRLSDIIALIIMVTIGSIGFQYGLRFIWVVALVILVGLVILSQRTLAHRLLQQCTRMPFLKTRAASLEQLYESSYRILRPVPLLATVTLSVISWSMEALGFYLTFLALGLPVGILPTLFIYSFATIAGAVSMLPGGLGLTEGSMTGLLVLLDIAKAPATAATLIIRVATLWFAVIIGTIGLIILQKRHVQPVIHRATIDAAARRKERYAKKA